MEKNLEYFVGLDIGVESCGACVTDKDYNILNVDGKDLWTVRLFDSAETASDRRAKRASRRLLQREKERISLLQSLFYEEVSKVDPNFFARLKASSFWEDDKLKAGLESRNSLFFDDKLDDKKFYKLYPTIYHLQDELLKEPAKDIRFLYLAIANMFKHRGNFLLESFNLQEDNLANLFKTFNDKISECEEFEFLKFNVSENELDKILKIEQELAEKPLKTSVLEQKFSAVFENVNSNQKALIKAICGGKINLKAIFEQKASKTKGKSEENEFACEAKIDNFGVDDSVIEQFLLEVEEESQNASEILELAKNVYDRIVFKKLLGNEDYFCSAMKNRYLEHKKQLKNFKEVIKKFYPESYSQVFKIADSKINNYVKYIKGSRTADEGTSKDSAKCSRADFYTYVKKLLESKKECTEQKEVAEILNDIENNNFLLKLRINENSTIPYQINKIALIKMLENSQSKFPFLLKVDESGLSVKDKIVSIFEFRIPYFVGPLSKKNSQNAWIEKKLNEKIYPWNFEKVVDLEKCEKEFIKRMQNSCTYLQQEPVLPKNSLLYCEYMVLSELNNIKINGEKLDRETKQQIFELFKIHGVVKISQIKSMLKQHGKVSLDQDVVISGIDENKFNCNYNIYKQFNNILNGEIESKRNEVEEIIYYATVISDKLRFEKWLSKNYGSMLSNAQIKKIKGLKIEGWGKFSKKFLDGIVGIDTKTGEARTIIDLMRDNSLNLMEILFNYDFSEAFSALKVKNDASLKITYKDVEDLYCSPAVKRGVYQAVQIVNEYERILGKKPAKIFVEVTRGEDNSNNNDKNERKKKLLEIYKQVDKNMFDEDFVALKERLENEDNSKLNSERLFLYYTQGGKCMYSGEPINFETELFSSTCDIDHIIPQSVFKDDSLNNKVLVKRTYNESKTNLRLVPKVYQTKMEGYWRILNKNGMISNEKLNRLIRTTEYSPEELKEFASRQLIFTGQTNKAVIDLFKSVYGEDKVIFSKAKFVSAFRNCEFEFDKDIEFKNLPFADELKQCLVKNRELNDLHHAKDAYLNIVVGNVFYEKYTKKFYLKDNSNYNFNLNNAFKFDTPGVFEKDKHIKTIIGMMNKNTPTVTFLSRQEKGKFYDETLYGIKKHQKDFKTLDEIKEYVETNKNANDKIPLKSVKNPLSQTIKYGYYNSAKTSYFTLIKNTQNGQKTIVAVDYLYCKDFKNQDDLKRYIINKLGHANFEIVIDKINIGSIFKIGCGLFKLAGKSKDNLLFHNFNQLYLPNKFNRYFKLISKIFKKINKGEELSLQDGKIVVNQNRLGEIEYITKEENLDLWRTIIRHLKKPLYDYNIGKIREVAESLESKIDMFVNLDIKKQIAMIFELLKIVNGKCGANLKEFDLSSEAGRIKMASNLKKNLPIKLVHYSKTGHYCREITI